MAAATAVIEAAIYLRAVQTGKNMLIKAKILDVGV
jgi:hypothetical protein